MKRVLFVLLDLLSAAFLAGGYVVQYFTRRKLGMLRWVNFQEGKLAEAVPVETVKYAALLVLLFFALWIVGRFVKKKNEIGKLDRVMLGVMVLLVAVDVVLTLTLTKDVTAAYFLILPLAGAAALMQIIRSGIAVFTCGGQSRQEG